MKKGAIVFFAVFLVFSLAALADKPSQDDLRMLRHLGENPNSVLVMTRNIYVGGNVDRVIEETDPNQVPLRVLETFAEVMSTDFNYRAQALADEIEQAQPHLIGIQEISLIRYQSPGDFFVDPLPNATYVVWDYLDILMQALEDRELDYEVAGIIQNADVELPMIVSFIPPYAFDDVRLTDFDVVLVRKDVAIDNVVEKNYAAMINFPPIIIPRGYVALDATVGHKTYRFVNTHLEPFIPAVQALQAAELMGDLASETLPIILVGDLNTQAPDGATYQTLLFNGFVDAWTENQVRPKIPGYTSGFDSDLRNETVDLDERIDLIMVKNHWVANGLPNIGPVFAYVVGDELGDRVFFPPDDLIWPSDHAGVVALLHIPIPGKNK
jgi:hypothetical protein